MLGRGTTVIAGDGNLADYLATLDRLRALADEQQLSTLLPGHGPLLADPAGVLDFYIAHRRERLAEIRAALAAGDRTGEEIVARVYANVDRSLWPFARWSVRAQLDYLGEPGRTAPGSQRLTGPAEVQWARLASRSASMISTDLADRVSHPRAAKSASALFTVSRDAPTSWASSSWVRS